MRELVSVMLEKNFSNSSFWFGVFNGALLNKQFSGAWVVLHRRMGVTITRIYDNLPEPKMTEKRSVVLTN
jgi:hypothetical protein